MRYSTYLVFLFVVFVLRCLPGIFVACLGWFLTGWMANKWAQVIVRGLLVALAVAPTVAGHAGLIPAAWIFLPKDLHRSFPDSRLGMLDLLPLLIVWSLAIPLIYALTRRSGRKQARPNSAAPN